MTPAPATCPKCRSTFPGVLCNTPEPVRCPACDATVCVEVFPAFFQAPGAGAVGESIIEEGVSSCFYHEGRKAVTHCEGCGRFVCALCDVDFGGRHLCPACLQAGRTKVAMPQLEKGRVLMDGAAMFLALCSAVPGLHFITAPAAIGLAAFSFFRPPSIVARSRLRAILALLLATALGVTWTLIMFLD